MLKQLPLPRQPLHIQLTLLPLPCKTQHLQLIFLPSSLLAALSIPSIEGL
jgi:hypothetical protein